MDIERRIIETAIENGATVAGIANMEALKISASHTIYDKMSDSEGINTVKDVEGLPDNEFISTDDAPRDNQLFNWPDSVKSILVVGLVHPKDMPELDWWDGRGTLGNRILIDIIKRTSLQIENSLQVKTRKLHYYVEKGGIFLKDAAVLAGLGCIGKNNMLITPSYGPRMRLRALFLESDVPPTGPIEFDPCSSCKVYCRKVCPENAMDRKAPIFKSIEFTKPLPGRDGNYSRDLCNIRMEKDLAEGSEKNSDKHVAIKFCRKCEYACPIGKRSEKNS
jgi:epoxyqueuosine reductase